LVYFSFYQLFSVREHFLREAVQQLPGSLLFLLVFFCSIITHESLEHYYTMTRLKQANKAHICKRLHLDRDRWTIHPLGIYQRSSNPHSLTNHITTPSHASAINPTHPPKHAQARFLILRPCHHKPLPSLHTHAINAHTHTIHPTIHPPINLPSIHPPRSHPIHLSHHHPPLLRLSLQHDLLRILHRLLLRLLQLIWRDTAPARPCDIRHTGIKRLPPDLLHLYLRLRWHLARLPRVERLLLPGVAMRRLLELGLARVGGADMAGHLLVLLLADVFLVGGVLVGLGLGLQAKRLLLLLVLVQALGGHLMLPVLHLLGEHLLMALVALLLCENGLSLARFLDLVDLFGG